MGEIRTPPVVSQTVSCESFESSSTLEPVTAYPSPTRRTLPPSAVQPPPAFLQAAVAALKADAVMCEGPSAGTDAVDMAASTRSCCTLRNGCSVAGPAQSASDTHRSMVHSLNNVFMISSDASTQFVPSDKENIDSNSVRAGAGGVWRWPMME